MRPAGAVAFIPPTKGIKGIVGRIIARRQGVPFSHCCVALGNGRCVDSTVPWTRLTDESYWDRPGVEWHRPSTPLSIEQARILRSIAYFIEGRIAYSIRNLFAFLIRGVPGERSHKLFCTYLVAELYMTLCNDDLSGCGQPWNIDIRELLSAVRRGQFVREP